MRAVQVAFRDRTCGKGALLSFVSHSWIVARGRAQSEAGHGRVTEQRTTRQKRWQVTHDCGVLLSTIMYHDKRAYTNWSQPFEARRARAARLAPLPISAALAHGLEHADARGDGHVEARHPPSHGDPDELVAERRGARAEAGVLRA